MVVDRARRRQGSVLRVLSGRCPSSDDRPGVVPGNQALQRGLDTTGRTIRIPSHMSKPARLVARAEAALEGRLGRRPTIEEIADEAALATDTVLLLRDVCHEPASLDRTVGDSNSTTLGTRISA